MRMLLVLVGAVAIASEACAHDHGTVVQVSKPAPGTPVASTAAYGAQERAAELGDG